MGAPVWQSHTCSVISPSAAALGTRGGMDIIQWKRWVGSSTRIITISLHFTSASDHHERHQVLLTTVTGLSLPSA